MLDSIMAMAEARLEILNRRRRETCPASDLVVGLQCGGSDAFSGVTANPALGFAADLLVRCRRHRAVLRGDGGARRHPPADAAGREPGGRRRADPRDGLVRRLPRQGRAPTGAPTRRPATRRAGSTTSSRRRSGSVAKSGTSAIAGVLAPGERVREKGLIFAATPASDFVCGTLQLASGMTLQVFTTGRGTPYGLAPCPRHQGRDPHRTGASAGPT